MINFPLPQEVLLNQIDLMKALYQYQQGFLTILMKTSSNNLFRAVQQQIVMRFFLESYDLLKKPLEKPQTLANLPLLNFSQPDEFFKDAVTLGYRQFEEGLKSWLDPSHSSASFLWQEFMKLIDPQDSSFVSKELLEELQKDSKKLLKGSELFLQDAINSPDGYFLIKTVDKNAFRIGLDLAATPGKVVYKNHLFELICYDQPAATSIPLLISMAWINKFYVFDLEPKYSFVKWLVEKGYQVFIISWINPDDNHKNLSLIDYMKDGLLKALEEVKKITGQEQISCLGYCLGGTIFSILAAYLAAQGRNDIKSLTLLTTLTDFQKVGPVEIFIKEDILTALEKEMERKGYLSGEDFFSTFSAIKSSDMIWYYFVNRYLLGKESKPLAVLYWNSDHTRVPYRLHQETLRKLYQANLLAKGELFIDHIRIRLDKITCPLYAFTAEEDHIAPWDSVYKGLKLFGSQKKRFVLSQSGHVAAVINHPSKDKYGFWSYDEKKDLVDDPIAWRKDASFKVGSWWDDLDLWLKSHNNPLETKTIEGLDQAPGKYILIK